MKLRNIIASFLAVVAMAVGCTQELTGNLSTIQLDQSTVVFPEEGGSVTITVTATSDWKVDAATVPAEVTITPMEGKAGETKMTISTEGSANDINADIVILVGVQKQFIKFYQPGDPALKPQFDEFVAGNYWIMCQEADEWFALKSTGCTIDDSGSYNYLYSVAAVVAEDGSLSSTASNVFTFEAVEGGFIIMDPAGGYLYQVAKYNNFYLTSDKAQASVWTVAQVSENEFMLEIPALSKWMQYSTGYDSAGAYATAQAGATLPKLVKAEAPAEDPFVIEQTEFELPIEGGEILVPVTYNGVDLHVSEMPEWLSFFGYHDGNLKFAYETNEGGKRVAGVVLSTCMEDGREGEVELTFTQEGIPPVTIPTIAEVIAAGAQTETQTEGVVVATYGRGVLLSDGTGHILVYQGSAMEPVVGDKIQVVGETTLYGGMLQFKNVTVTPVSSGNEVVRPEPTVLDAAGMDAQLAKTVVEYIEYVGTLSVSGNYYNVNIDGAATAIGSLQYIDASAHPAAVDGAKIKVRGYFIGVSSGKYVNTMTVAVEAVEDETPEVDPWEAEGVATYVLDEFMYTDYPQYCALTELKAYADETNLYARLKTTKNSGVAKLRLCTADTNEGTETVWYWEKSFYSTPVYKSDKVSVDADFNFALSYNGTAVALNTVVDGDVVYWEMTIPRAAHEHTSAAGAVNLGFVSYNADGGENGLMPKVWGEMLKVTLP